jgi:hypothetical protein
MQINFDMVIRSKKHISENEEHCFLTDTSRSLLYWLFAFKRCVALPAICCVIAGACGVQVRTVLLINPSKAIRVRFDS